MASNLGGAGGVFEQFAIWGVLLQIAQAILAPPLLDVQQRMFQALPDVALSPAQLADLTLKNWIPRAIAESEAAKSGINPEWFDQMVNDTGEPLALQSLLEAWRRGFIGWDGGAAGDNSVIDGIRQSRIRDQWAPVIEKLRDILIPITDAVAATIRGQIPYAEGEAIALQNGLPAADFRILVNTAGNPPGPQELITLTRRGLIPVEGVGPDALTLQQGIYEGDQKDKWFPLYVKLMEYLPPPRTITALERAGVITSEQATKLYQQQGLTAELAAAYSRDASSTKLAKTKTLAEGTVLNLYRGGVIPESEAATLLGALGYTSQEGAWILAWEDLHRELAALNSAVTKIGTLYINRKIGATTAIAAMGTLGLPHAQQTELLRVWELERQSVVKVLTPAEIGDAVKYAIMDQATGQAALESLGYEPYDAWVRLSLSQNAALPGAPPLPAEPTGALQ